MNTAKFAVGDVIRHQKFGYRGVIIDVDATFKLTDEWYEQVAHSRPPKDKPWYHVLVHEARQQTYVAERHLELALEREQIDHPDLGAHFHEFRDGRYYGKKSVN